MKPGHPVLAARNTSLPEITKDSGAAEDANTLVVELFDLRGQGLSLHSPCPQGLQQPAIEATAVNVQTRHIPLKVNSSRCSWINAYFTLTFWQSTRGLFLGCHTPL